MELKKNLNQAHDATDNFIDNLQKNNVVINKNIILDITSFIQINKDLEEGIKSRNKLKKMNSQIKKLQDQINQNENDSEIEM